MTRKPYPSDLKDADVVAEPEEQSLYENLKQKSLPISARSAAIHARA